jgi:hypothetical protein
MFGLAIVNVIFTSSLCQIYKAWKKKKRFVAQKLS